jgi:transcriptional antiterminator RfaH
MSEAWYVARTRPRTEHRAKDGLEREGIECFLPTVAAQARGPGSQDGPLFPGYLFVRYDHARSGTAPFHHVPEIAGLVAFGGEVPAVPDEIMSDLRQQVDQINGRGGLLHQIKPGDHVWIRLGAKTPESLAEVDGGSRAPHGLVRVLLRFLGQLTKAEVPTSALRFAREDEVQRERDSARPRRRTRGKGRYLRCIEPRPDASAEPVGAGSG